MFCNIELNVTKEFSNYVRLVKWIQQNQNVLSCAMLNDKADVKNLIYVHILTKLNVSIKEICLPSKGLKGHLPQPIPILRILALAELL